MIANIETTFKCNFETVVKNLNKSSTHKYISSPMLTFTPTNTKDYSGNWVDGEVKVRMKLFDRISIGKQVFRIQKIQENHKDEYIIRDNGYGELAHRWDHWVFVRKTGKENKTTYIDRIEVKAGILTIFVWLFANIFYRWRQFRWKKLIKNSFKQLETM